MSTHLSPKIFSTHCYLCGSKDKLRISVENNHSISKCLNCGFLYVSEIPMIKDGKVIGEYYSDDKLDDSTEAGEADVNIEHLKNGMDKYQFVTDFLVTEFKKRKPSGKLLDVGCGFGAVMIEAEKKGFEVYGTELSKIAVNFIKQNTSIQNIECSVLTDEVFKGVNFDLINLTNVLEHVPNPREILHDCGNRLSDGGVLVVRVPNMRFHKVMFYLDSILVSLKIQKNRRVGILASSPPIHLGGFSDKTLKFCMEKAGLKATEIKPSKLSGFVNKRLGYRLFEGFASLVFHISAKRLNICPTIIAFAKRK